MRWEDGVEWAARYECPFNASGHEPALEQWEIRRVRKIAAVETGGPMDLLQSVCETCDLPIALDEEGWSDIWFTKTGIVYGPGGYMCSATSFKGAHVPSVEQIRAHLTEMERELSA